MKLAYSNRLHSNYIIIERADRKLTVEHIVRTARMHRCVRLKGGKTFIAVSFELTHEREAERLLQEHQLQAELERLTSVA